MEKCICLCSNCHILVRSKLVNYADDIFEDPLIRTDFIKNYYKIITNIKKFKYPINIVESSPPLELKFSQNEFWKIHFMKISIILQNHKKHYFTVVDLANLLLQDQRSIRYYLDRLVSMELLNKTQENAFPFENTYRITEEDRNILEKLKELHQKTYKELKNDIFSMDDYMERQNRWTL
jgi:predicted transcriptional regulator